MHVKKGKKKEPVKTEVTYRAEIIKNCRKYEYKFGKYC